MLATQKIITTENRLHIKTGQGDPQRVLRHAQCRLQQHAATTRRWGPRIRDGRVRSRSVEARATWNALHGVRRIGAKIESPPPPPPRAGKIQDGEVAESDGALLNSNMHLFRRFGKRALF